MVQRARRTQEDVNAAVVGANGKLAVRRSTRLASQGSTGRPPSDSSITKTGTPSPRRFRRKKARTNGLRLPPTPESLPRLSRSKGGRRAPRTALEQEVESVVAHPHSPPPTPLSEKRQAIRATVAPAGSGQDVIIGKIHLAQERVRHDPWKLLVCTCLMNKTSGRAARPVFNEILANWPTARELAKVTPADLADILYPIGLFNQRAASLIRMSQQYIEWGWPLLPMSASPLTSASDHDWAVPEVLDVNIFYGAGRYASDSFRIYSDLLPGQGAPRDEAKWLKKRERALARRATVEGSLGEREDPALEVKDLSDWLSDDDGDDSGDEWRMVRPNDKELLRYLIWRWGLEGITYDLTKGPIINKVRDRRRVGSLEA